MFFLFYLLAQSVFQLLTDLKQQRKESGKSKQSSGQQNLNTIMYETLKYISKTPCRYQSPETVKEFLVAMKGHKLTKAEKLQLLNHRPVTAVEIQLVSNNAPDLLPVRNLFCLLLLKRSVSVLSSTQPRVSDLPELCLGSCL
uniref:DNA-directed RNA polymerase III subunit RPC9 n=1 Tax=Phasianus colchicus TaxID=9054 RepID=A0A669PD13_PHACC